jgi:hypothetical protein
LITVWVRAATYCVARRTQTVINTAQSSSSRISAFGIAARTRRRLDRTSGIAFLGLAGAVAATER